MDFLAFFTPGEVQLWAQQLAVHAPCYFLSNTPLISFRAPPPLLSCLTCSSFCPVAEELVSGGWDGWRCWGPVAAPGIARGSFLVPPTTPSDVQSIFQVIPFSLFIQNGCWTIAPFTISRPLRVPGVHAYMWASVCVCDIIAWRLQRWPATH